MKNENNCYFCTISEPICFSGYKCPYGENIMSVKRMTEKMGKKSMRLGMGGRFEKGKEEIMEKEGYSEDRASAIMASAGRKKYGAKKMAKWAAKGVKRNK